MLVPILLIGGVSIYFYTKNKNVKSNEEVKFTLEERLTEYFIDGEINKTTFRQLREVLKN
ncbi:hypothetical protein [Helicovermis profundi]|uniref:SHOCT domain-containing protein n=1 Tax=Helicovermis profundi TaxID=3065157 RepID=A0AAU9EM26_9FIRM|nr:hypothetical protein HLPR_06420 [Clostridia bacterium S502]